MKIYFCARSFSHFVKQIDADNLRTFELHAMICNNYLQTISVIQTRSVISFFSEWFWALILIEFVRFERADSPKSGPSRRACDGSSAQTASHCETCFSRTRSRSGKWTRRTPGARQPAEKNQTRACARERAPKFAKESVAVPVKAVSHLPFIISIFSKRKRSMCGSEGRLVLCSTSSR